MPADTTIVTSPVVVDAAAVANRPDIVIRISPRDDTDYINGQVLHIERGRIHTYYFGEDLRSLYKGGDGMFTVDELIETVPGSLMNGITPVVPPVKMSEAVKSGDAKKSA